MKTENYDATKPFFRNGNNEYLSANDIGDAAGRLIQVLEAMQDYCDMVLDIQNYESELALYLVKAGLKEAMANTCTLLHSAPK